MTGIPLSVVVPAYNEEARLRSCLDRIVDYLNRRGQPYEILVVDDGSRDQTRAIVEARAASEPRVSLLALPVNQGKGAAVTAGMLKAEGDWILLTDVDLSTPIEDLEILESHRARSEVIIGSRALGGAVIGTREPAGRACLGSLFNRFVRLSVLPVIRDTQCGFKLWSRDAARKVFRRMRIRRFAYDVESLWLASRMGFRIAEIPVHWSHDTRSKVRVGRDGARMMIDLFRLLLRRTLGG
jgi:dolichyl-phosphate beta-glucosyltransferase